MITVLELKMMSSEELRTVKEMVKKELRFRAEIGIEIDKSKEEFNRAQRMLQDGV